MWSQNQSQCSIEGARSENLELDLWLDRATIQFRFYQPNSGYTGSFCVFGPALSSPAHASIPLVMRQIEIEIVFVL